MRFACIIPLYNHAKTVLTVAQGAKKHISDVRIVDDGSTDLPENFEEDLEMIHSILNKGEYAVHHSDIYNAEYHPHYRIIEKEIFEEEILKELD